MRFPSPNIAGPLFLGRLFRVVTGVSTLMLLPIMGFETIGGWGLAGLLFLGVSFIVSGVTGNLGCEVTALPNLVLPESRQVRCFCPLWTPSILTTQQLVMPGERYDILFTIPAGTNEMATVDYFDIRLAGILGMASTSIQSTSGDIIFQDDFESGDISAWS